MSLVRVDCHLHTVASGDAVTTLDELAERAAAERLDVVFITDHKGAERRLGPGDMAFFPAGSKSTWRVPVEVRKLATCRQAMPGLFGFALRVWNKLGRTLKPMFWPEEDMPADALAPRPARDGARVEA